MQRRKWLRSAVSILCAVPIAVSTFVVQFAASAEGTIQDVPLAQPYVLHNYGTGDPQSGIWEGMQLFNREDKANTVDATKAKYLEFDFFVDDTAKLKKNETENAGMVISLSGGDQQDIWKQRAMYWFQDELTQSGWTHIRIDLSQEPNGGYNGGETDFTEVFGVIVAASEACEATVRVANVALTTDDVVTPSKPDNIVAELKSDTIVKESLTAFQCFSWAKSETPVDRSSAKYIEMDLFVEDYESYSVAKNGSEKAGIYLNLFSGAVEKKTEIAVHDYVVNNGWNHVRLSIPGDVDLAAFRGFEVGPWESYNGRFGIANVCLTQDAELTAPAKPDNIVKEMGMDIVEVPSLTAYSDFAIKRFEKEDLSEASFIEMDLYIDDYADFSTAKNGNDKVGIYLHLFSGEDGDPPFDAELSLHTKITKSGWNHVRLAIPTDLVDMSQFTGYAIGPWEPYANRFAVANVCLTEEPVLVAPAKPDNIVKEMGMDIVEVPSLTAYSDFAIERFDKTDLSEALYVELDLYIDDYADFSTAKNGNDKVGIYLHLFSGEDDSEPPFDVELPLQDQIRKDGWNHAVVAIPADKVDMTQFTGYAVGPWEPYANRFAVANVCLTKDAPKPALPGDITFVVDEGGFSNNAWTDELVFKEYGDRTYDLSGSKYFEIDLYISEEDYALYSANPQNVGFSLGSDAQNKWVDRAVYQGKLNFTQAGWNHFKVPLEESSYWEGDVDFTQIHKVLIYHEGLQTIDPVTIRFVNACFTSGPEEIGPDENETEKKPDKDAYYLSDCENLTDAFGTWNSAGDFNVDLANRTEGDASIRMVFNSVYNSIRYVNNLSLDLTKADKLKFDLFIANEEVMKEFTDGFIVRLASNGKYREDYAYAVLKETDLKAGWNRIEISIGDLQQEGTANLGSIDTFGLFYVNGTFGDLDELTVKLDNIRFSGTVTEAGGTTGGDEQKPGGPETGESDGVPALVLVAAVSASAVLALRRKKIAG
ncbi:MAG TPA: hypothetical protein H9684_10180 [Firmicutes bacterium]|nr:hypothetical protein [Bacillota bacterium]